MMELNLLDKTVNQLLEKFGAGNHKPGSGSAAAFQGMVSAKLISTVISLTADEKRKQLYSSYIIELIDFQEQIEKRIYPELANLFQLDSDQFDKTIILRKARDKEEDEVNRNQLRRQALEELKLSIKIPFQIATLCKELAEMSAFVFDNGFRAARGDSQVSLGGAVSALGGCIAIIRLNVLSFYSDEYAYCKSVVLKLDSLDKDYQRLSTLSDTKIDALREEFEEKIPLFDGLNKLKAKYRNQKNINIEQCVRDLQNLIWSNKHLIWRKSIPHNHLEILQPNVIFKQVLGFDYLSSTTYGVFYSEDDIVEVAGVIDQPNKLVAISNKFRDEVRRFTAAHELGHAIMHNQPLLHRDMPIDYPGQISKRVKVEFEADKFASYFLMPKKLLLKAFGEIFSFEQFVINEDTAFKFGGRSTLDLKQECKNLRDLSRKLASTEFFNNDNFISLSKQFNVSVEAMAIRLEELKLVKY